MKEPLDILKQYWGYDAFRPLQMDIIQNALQNRDGLALLPTGGGKSLCFQVPALCRDGICIVISPLIALMKDQVHNLKKRNIAAAAIYSGMHRRELDIIFENACNGAYKLLYLSPERLKTELARERIKRMKVSLLAIDEAHCISQWGYDFRPPYLEIKELRSLIPNVPVLALTATATPEVVEDIQEKLGFEKKQVFQQSFSRKNLSYSVLYESRKMDKLLDILKNVPGSGVIYARSRGETKEIADFLIKKGHSASFYHAGLSAEERSNRQDAWIQGKVRLMVCTNAFGMGIDKPNVRLVVHLSLPDSLEAYFQEAGRAGRDGEKAYAVMLYEPHDGESNRNYLKLAFPGIESLRHIYRILGSFLQLAIGGGIGQSYDFDFQAFCNTYHLNFAETHAILRLLEQEGWIVLTEAAAGAAQIQVLADRETLYDYQLRFKTADKVLKALLRLYPGIQNDLMDISEASICKMANLPLDITTQILQNAHKEGLLEYFPKKDKPQITFLRERVSAENLTIDFEKFNFRKSRAEEKVERGIQYAETLRCRSQQLLAYFGEKDAPKCGVCDVCTGRNKSDQSNDDLEAYSKKIREVLRVEPLTFEQILEAFAPKRHEIVAQTINYLREEGQIELIDQDKLTWQG